MIVPALIAGNKTWKLVKIKENEADVATGIKLLRKLAGYWGKRQKERQTSYMTRTAHS
jgi:hypothetical protein